MQCLLNWSHDGKFKVYDKLKSQCPSKLKLYGGLRSLGWQCSGKLKLSYGKLKSMVWQCPGKLKLSDGKLKLSDGKLKSLGWFCPGKLKFYWFLFLTFRVNWNGGTVNWNCRSF